MADVTLTRKAGSEEPEEFTVDATGLTNLDAVDAGHWFMWKLGATDFTIDGDANGVASDGPGFRIIDSAARTVELDPDGAGPGGANAFAVDGVYLAVLRLVFSDDDDQFWPDDGYVEITLEKTGP